MKQILNSPIEEKFLQPLAKALHCSDDPEKALRITRTILHTLRDNLSLNDAIRVLKLLPYSLKRIYISDWNYSQPSSKWLNPFLLTKAVRSAAGKIAYYDFPSEADTERSIKAIFGYIETNITEKKKHILRSILPYSLLTFFQDASPSFYAICRQRL